MAKKLSTRMRELGLTKENAKVFATCAGGLGLYGIAVTTVDEGAKAFSSSDDQYRAITRQIYGSPGGKIAGAVATVAAISFMQDMAIDNGYLKKASKRKARAAAVGFTGAALLTRLTVGNIGQRFDYLSAGSITAAINPTGNDAVMITNAQV